MTKKPQRLVECVPNFSEGRREEVIQAIVGAIAAVPQVYVLDTHSDPDHNRTVVTFVGPPEAVEEAAFQGAARAAELIDMTQHRGEHPRIGATDVIPFVPLQGVTMADCVAMAERVARRIAAELEIPTYLYAEAARRPDRRRLATIRRGEYEGLREAIATDPDRAPDFGPARLGKAGATVVGARPFLIAFNVYLNTDDVRIADRIARAVRHSSGGLRYVQAKGFLVEGQAQVSMNLTNYEKTPIQRVVNLIRQEAARYGVAVTHSELVGLIPQAALVEAARWHLQLDLFEPDQVLENRLAAAMEAETTPTAFLDAVAAPTPTPGGGAVSALAAALAAALAQMVAGLTVGRKKYALVEEAMQEVLAEAGTLRVRLTAAVAQDSAAFDAVMAAYRMPKGTEAEKAARRQAIQEATRRAGEVPLAVAREAVATLRLIRQVAEVGNVNAVTDAGVAAHLAWAAVEGAALNVRVNALALEDEALRRRWLAEVEALREQAGHLWKKVSAVVVRRAGLEQG
ncbi:MAG TPA: glutamate formimidoyltransferase [Chloroflexi bacterium]|nr:glutamate formimidoyltransferase [Chloroflexota bacterium]